MLTRTLSALAAVGLTFATLALATPLEAAPPGEDMVQVKTGDLDLTTARGVATLDRRVRAAAREICGSVPIINLNMQRQVADCQDSVIASARADVEFAVAAARSGRSLALRDR